MYNLVNYDPTQQPQFNDPNGGPKLPATVARFTPGELGRAPGGKTFLFVQHHAGTDNVVVAAGMPAYWRDRDNFIVTADKTDNLYGATLSEGVAGFYQGVVDPHPTTPTTAAGNFTWLQMDGIVANVPLSGVGAIGNRLIPPASNTDNQLTTVAIAAATAAQAASQLVAVQKTLGTGGSNLAQIDLRLHLYD